MLTVLTILHLTTDSIIHLVIPDLSDGQDCTGDSTEDPNDNESNPEESNVDDSIVENTINKITKDQPSKDPNNDPSNLDDSYVQDQKEKTDNDHPIVDDSTKDPNEDESKLDDLIGNDSHDKIAKAIAEEDKKVSASGTKRKCRVMDRELGKLQDSLSRNEIIPKGKRRCAK